MLEKRLEAANSGNSTIVDHTSDNQKAVDYEIGLKQKQSIGAHPPAPSHGITSEHPTSYLESLIHLFKGNIGPGLFAMGDAFKNAGIVTAPVLTLIIAVISVHCQHVLLCCSAKMQEISKLETYPDFAETVELCFVNGPPKLRGWSSSMKTAVNIFICVTQLGFCCIYFVFVTTNASQLLKYYEMELNDHLIMAIFFVPILVPSLITNLKYLAPVSMTANVCMVSGIVITMYYAFREGVPSPTERHYFTGWETLPLYFGTAIFAFEGIALVLPLKNSMEKPHKFDRPLGVLNVGMTAVSFLFIFAGFFGYLKWGESVGPSLTLNVEVTEWLGQAVKIAVSLGVLMGYPLQFFVAIQIMWPPICSILKIKPTLCKELLFRTIMVIVTFGIAEGVPKLNLFISLIGALCSTALALVFPPMIDLIVAWDTLKGPGATKLLKNIFILLIALLGFSTGSYESISSIVREFLYQNK